MIEFSHPIWLLLALPTIALFYFRPPPTRTLGIIRGLIFITLIIAIADPQKRDEIKQGTLVLVVDRSQSMPANSLELQKELIQRLTESKGEQQNLKVISFGDRSAIESGGDLSIEVGDQSSRLSEALELALLSIPPETQSRIIVVSDGIYTHRKPDAMGYLAASRNIPIDYRLMTRPQTGDLGIYDLDYPVLVTPNEVFQVTAWIQSPLPQKVKYTLKRGTSIVAEGEQDVPAGTSSLRIRELLETPQTGQYVLEIAPANLSKDPVPENNQARFLVRATGVKPILILTEKNPSPLQQLLELGGLSAVAKSPGSVLLDLAELSNYSGVIIEDIPHQSIGDLSVSELVAWVENNQGGVLLTGGKRSFGQGGYYKSRLEEILPVTMELRKEFRKGAIAMVLVLDRSGSMQMPASGGKTKMDLANIASANVVDLLTEMDEVGVLAVDTAPHKIVGLTKLTAKETVRNKILKIQSMGGGIFVYAGLAEAVRMLRTSSAAARHIILFSDAADSEQPGAYKKLLEECQREGITCSVIALGSKSDPDAGLLVDIAKRGNGRSFFTTKAKELPELFAQDTFTIARSFIDEKTPVRSTPNLATILPGIKVDSKTPVEIGGYNLTYVRPKANLAMVTADENKAPLLATWHVGLGRTAVYTGQIDGRYTGPIAAWENYPKLLNSLSRWFSREDSFSGDGYVLTQRIENGEHIITLHLDSDATRHNITTAPTIQTLSSRLGEASTKRIAKMDWISPQKLEFRENLDGNQTQVSTVILPISDPDRPELPGKVITLAPAKPAYPAEFKPVVQTGLAAERGGGIDALQVLATQTGGTQRLEMKDAWESIKPTVEFQSFASWLYLATILMVLGEILERRTGYIGQIYETVARRKSRATASTSQESSDEVEGEVETKSSVTASIFGWWSRRRKKSRKTTTSDSGGMDRPRGPATGPNSGVPSGNAQQPTGRESADSAAQQASETQQKESGQTSVRDALAKARAKSRGRMKK